MDADRLGMPWYAAHAVMYVRFKDGTQDRYPVWENVLLIEAGDEGEAWRKGRDRAKQDEGDSQGTFTWGGRPAAWVFAGLRKVIAVSHHGSGDVPADGDEVTFAEYEVPDAASVERLVAGGAVTLKYVE